MKFWIFQGKPERYDVAIKVKPFQEETWLVTRYREEMSIGDIVFFWRSGDKTKRGIYGWGTLISKPTYFVDWGWGIKVRYQIRFYNPLFFSLLKELEKFSSNLIFRMPIGTNFQVSKDEFDEISNLIDRTNSPEQSPKNH